MIDPQGFSSQNNLKYIEQFNSFDYCPHNSRIINSIDDETVKKYDCESDIKLLSLFKSSIILIDSLVGHTNRIFEKLDDMIAKFKLMRKMNKEVQRIHPQCVDMDLKLHNIYGSMLSSRNYNICWDRTRFSRECRHLIRRFVLQEILGYSCWLCGARYDNAILDRSFTYHHIEYDSKKLEMTKAWHASDRTLVDELTKCVQLCFNCHHKENASNLDTSDIYKCRTENQYKFDEIEKLITQSFRSIISPF